MCTQQEVDALHVISHLNGDDANKISIPIAYLQHFTNPQHAYIYKQVCFWWNQKKGDWNYCSYEAIGEDFGMNAGQSRRAVKFLADNGYIETRKRMVNGSPTMDYKVIPAKILELTGHVSKPTVAPPNQVSISTGACVDIDVSITDITTDSNKTHTLNSCPNELPFARFWLDYPRKDAKKDAIKAFKQITKGKTPIAIVEIINEIIFNLANRNDFTDPKYTPLAATYLRGERWNDPIKPQDDSFMQKHAGDKSWREGV